MDGNSPIGEDKSGRGNNWTPVNFGGSLELDNPNVSGARPILNTGTGGTVARPGVFGSEVGAYYAVTVASVGGGNRYHFDGVDRPNPTLTRGATYTFDQSDSSNSNHPLRFSTTSNGSHGGGSEYTDGVTTNGTPGSAGAYTKITVPHNSADTLYYYCTNHSNMGSSTSQITDETKADPYAWKNVLALSLVGNANDASNSVNSGSTTKTATPSGALASSAASNFYNRSFFFDGSNDYIALTDNADFAFGTGDSTVELWVYPNTLVSNDVLYDGRQSTGGTTTGFSIVVNGSGNVQTYTAGGYRCSSTAQLKIGKWSHIAVVRSSGTDTLFMDGIAQADTDTTNGNYTDQKCRIGSDVNGSEAWGGHISDFRLYKGVAKYTSNFVVPATSPDILPDTPSGVSGGSKLAKVTDGAVYFDGSGDSLSIADNADFDFGSGDFTVELFTYNDPAQSSNPVLIGATGGWYLQFKTGGTIVEFYTGSTSIQATGLGLEGGWHHIAVTKASNVVKIFIDGILKSTTSNSDTTNLASTLYIGNLNGASLHYLGFISNVRVIKGTALYTTNFIPPTRTLTNVTNTKLLCCQSNTSATAAAVTPGTITIPNPGYEFSTAKSYSVYSDAARGANYTVQYSANNSDWTTAWTGVMTANSECGIINGTGGGSSYGRHNYWRYVEGSATQGHHPRVSRIILTTTGGTDVNIKVYTSDNCSDSGTYEVNTVTYTDSTYGTQTNQTAPTTLNPFTTDINAVRGQETGYATLNPLDSNQTLSNGNLICGSSNSHAASRATLSISTGKYYWEVDAGTGWGNDPAVGIMTPSAKISDQLNATGSKWWRFNGVRFYDGTEGSVWSSSVSSNSGKIVGVSFDADNGTFEIFIDGISQGFAFTGLKTGQSPNLGSTTSDTWIPATKTYSGSFGINFGQKPFKYAPPAGFQPLNAANVRPVKVIARPDQYVEATIYDGNGGTKNVSTNHSPDFVWIKHRTRSQAHVLYDSVRTAGTGKALASNSNGAEGAQSDGTTYGYLSAFNKNGFTVIKGSDGEDYVNKNATGYVAWSWKAGGNKNTFNVDDVGYASAAAAGITEGTISLTGASIGTKQGFSIVSYSGSGSNGTFGHGLLETPNLIIVKCRNVTQNWAVQHSAYGPTKYTYLNSTNEARTTGAAAFWNNTAPTNSTVSVGTDNDTNASGSGRIYIAYCWHDVPGLQKFGSYIGNGNNDGTFVETGFRPTLLWIKNTTTNGELWCAHDSKRDPINPAKKRLELNGGGAEDASQDARIKDFLSNGFKIRGQSGEQNTSGDVYIYAAWAEAPVSGLYGAQSNAR